MRQTHLRGLAPMDGTQRALTDAVLGTPPNKSYYKVQFWTGKRAESQMIYARRLGQGETTGC